MHDSPMKVGIFGGTFDPIHWGHLTLAQQAIAQFALDQVVWVPAGSPPHKTVNPAQGSRVRSLTPFADRLAMVQQAIAPYAKFQVSAIEATPSQSHSRSYAIHTFGALRQHYESIYGTCQWYWLLGLDSFQSLPQWYRSAELAVACTWLVARRSLGSGDGHLSTSKDICERVVTALTAQLVATAVLTTPVIHWHLLDMPPVSISSTGVRQRCQSGQSIHALVPVTVATYIDQQQLYRASGDRFSQSE